jgi:hypothetical protein
MFARYYKRKRSDISSLRYNFLRGYEGKKRETLNKVNQERVIGSCEHEYNSRELLG